MQIIIDYDLFMYIIGTVIIQQQNEGIKMKVFVYFNLHKKLWSVKALEGLNKGKVMFHMTNLTLINAEFKVSESGRQRVLKDKCKNVHAGVVGDLQNYVGDFSQVVTYRPYELPYFYNKVNLNPVYHASVVSFNSRKVTIAK